MSSRVTLQRGRSFESASLAARRAAGRVLTTVADNPWTLILTLFWMYFTRALAIAIYLAAPKTSLTFYLFAAVLGFTWLATVPPTAGLVGKLFGVRYLATLDVVRRHGPGAGRSVHKPADSRGAYRAARTRRDLGVLQGFPQAQQP